MNASYKLLSKSVLISVFLSRDILLLSICHTFANNNLSSFMVTINRETIRNKGIPVPLPTFLPSRRIATDLLIETIDDVPLGRRSICCSRAYSSEETDIVDDASLCFEAQHAGAARKTHQFCQLSAYRLPRLTSLMLCFSSSTATSDMLLCK